MVLPAESPSTTAPAPAPGPRPWVLILGLLLVVAVYARSLGGDFVWDDRYLILEDQRIQDRYRIEEVLTAPFVHAEGAGRLQSYYRPLTTLSYFLDYQWHGPEPAGYHWANLLLHLLVSVLLWRLLLPLVPDRWLAALLGMLFALHPVHVASVAWIAGRVDLLCAVFLLLALWVVQQARSSAWPPAARWAALPALFLALAAKEIALLFLVLLLLLDLHQAAWRPGRLWRSFDWRFYLGAAVVCAGFLLLHQQVVAASPEPPSLQGIGDRLVAAVSVLALYLRTIFLPFDLRGFYFPELVASWQWGSASVGIAFLVLVVAAFWRRLLLVRTGAVWTLLLLLPVLDLVAFESRCVYLAADHRAYLPSIGGILLFAGLLRPAWQRLRNTRGGQIALLLGGVSLLSLFAFETYRGIGRWQDEDTLFASLVRETPCDETYLLQGFAAFERGDVGAAESAFRAGAHCAPENWRQHFGLGEVLLQRGDNVAAKAALLRAAAIPGAFTTVFNDLGNLYMLERDHAAARSAYERALQLSPNNHLAMYNLGLTCLELGERPLATQWLRRFVAEAPAAYAAQKQAAVEMIRRQ